MELRESQVVDVTPEIAKSYLEDSYEHQRKIDWDFVTFLSNEMAEGRFSLNNIDLAYNGTGKRNLTDGHHTLLAIVQSHSTIRLPVHFIHVKNKQELQALYATTNIGRKRTYSDSLKAHGTEGETEIPHGDLNKLTSALRYFYEAWPKYGTKKRVPILQVHEMCLKWADHYRCIVNLTEGAHEDVLVRIKTQGALSVFLPLLRFSSHMPQSHQFIEGVAAGSSLDNKDPRKALHYYLVSFTGAGVKSRSIAMASATALAWQKFATGKTLEKIHESTIANRKIDIAGTSFYIDGRPRHAGKSITWTQEKLQSSQD